MRKMEGRSYRISMISEVVVRNGGGWWAMGDG